jgi:hypothetical protein
MVCDLDASETTDTLARDGHCTIPFGLMTASGHPPYVRRRDFMTIDLDRPPMTASPIDGRDHVMSLPAVTHRCCTATTDMVSSPSP